MRVLYVAVAALLVASVYAGTTPEGLKFLEENAKREGVVTLNSGLQYRILKSGDPSGQTATRSDKVECHYRGTLMDGTEFDSSYKRGRPATFGVTQVIRGWTEALQMMRPGDKWELAIPSELAYGDRQRGQFITPGAVLMFDVELLNVVGRKREL